MNARVALLERERERGCVCGGVLKANGRCRDGIYWTYMLEMAWYLQGVYTHVFVDSRKKDFYEMLLHHFAAFALLYGSFNLGYVASPVPFGTYAEC